MIGFGQDLKFNCVSKEFWSLPFVYALQSYDDTVVKTTTDSLCSVQLRFRLSSGPSQGSHTSLSFDDRSLTMGYGRGRGKNGKGGGREGKRGEGKEKEVVRTTKVNMNFFKNQNTLFLLEK